MSNRASNSISGSLRLQFLAVIFAITPALIFAQERVFRAADIHPDGYPTVEAVEYMGKLLSEATDERLSIKVYSGRQLGEERDTLEQTVFGAIDLNRVFLPILNNVVRETMVLTLPFIFRSRDHADLVLRGEIGQDIFDAMEPYGLVGLAYYDSGIRSMYTSGKPMRHPDDLNGMRIRVPNSDVSVAMIDALGGNATPMEFGQIYEALRNGTIDGAENNLPAYSTTQHFEVAPVYSLTEHAMPPEVLVMSRLTWDKLSPQDQQLVREAARASMDYMRALWLEREQQAFDRVTAGGATIVGDIDKTPFIEAVEPVYAEYADDVVLSALIRRIQEVRE